MKHPAALLALLFLPLSACAPEVLPGPRGETGAEGPQGLPGVSTASTDLSTRVAALEERVTHLEDHPHDCGHKGKQQ